ncbi:energy transducer TonB [Pseudomonadota bacterium]
MSPLIQERYLAELLEQVKASKYYPSLARRKNIEGAVVISFTLLEGGRIENLQVEGGHKLLRKAAADAVRKAKDIFPSPPKTVSLPLQVRFSMEFKLR